ncbi:MAG: hypothetical protein Q9165_008680 [Trypethelium subeluteriae]
MPHSPSYEHIRPIGSGHHFSYTRSQSRDLSSRPSSASGRPVIPSTPASRSRSDRDRSSSQRPSPLLRRVFSEGDFAIEEIGSQRSLPSDLEVIRPDSSEDATSNSGESERSDPDSQDEVEAMIRSMSGLKYDDRTHRERRRKKRQQWREKNPKRSLSKIQSDTDMEDVSGLNAREMARSGRRQRLKVTQSEDDVSVPPEEYKPEAWLEVEDSATRPSTSGSDTNGRAAETLPFFSVEDMMQIDRELSRETTPRGT